MTKKYKIVFGKNFNDLIGSNNAAVFDNNINIEYDDGTKSFEILDEHNRVKNIIDRCMRRGIRHGFMIEG